MPDGSTTPPQRWSSLMSRTKAPDATNPAASFSPEALAALINEVNEGRKAMAEQMKELAELKATMAAKPQATSGKSDQSHKNELATVRAFRKAGFGTLVPHEDIRTFTRW